MNQTHALPARTLIDALRPDRTLVQNIGLALMGSLFTAIMAQVAIPMPPSPVPVTGQTFAVLLVGALLGSRLGAATIALYVAQGAIGLPVYAEFKAGFAVLLGPTGGYLLSFPLAAFLVGWLAERDWDRTFLGSMLAMSLATTAIFVMGAAQLALFAPAGQVFALGVGPYLPGAFVKILVAAALLPSGWSLLERWRTS